MADLLGIFGFLVVLLRAATLCLQTILAGGVIFLCFVASDEGLRPEELTRPAWKLIRWSGAGLAICEIAFLMANLLVLGSSTGISVREMLGANFAVAGMVAIVASLTVALWPESLRKSVHRAVIVPAILILASSVVTSHSFSRMDGRAALVGLTSLHYLATASWIGGLPYLLLSMKRISEQGIRIRISRRFSWLAQISVAVLFLAGLGMSLVFVGSWNALYGTAYGIMVGTKVVLFGCLLLLGAANYFIVREGGTASTTGAMSLRRFGEVELGIGLTVILAAASLTSQPPGADLTEDRASLHEIAVRYAPRMPQLTRPPL